MAQGVAYEREPTLQGTITYPFAKALQKMIFLFARAIDLQAFSSYLNRDLLNHYPRNSMGTVLLTYMYPLNYTPIYYVKCIRSHTRCWDIYIYLYIYMFLAHAPRYSTCFCADHLPPVCSPVCGRYRELFLMECQGSFLSYVEAQEADNVGTRDVLLEVTVTIPHLPVPYIWNQGLTPGSKYKRELENLGIVILPRSLT